MFCLIAAKNPVNIYGKEFNAMNWIKLGLIFNPEILVKRGLTAALMPIPQILDQKKNLVKVYFAPRDSLNRSELHYFIIDLNNPFDIKEISEKPIFQHGVTGAFDDSGITPGNMLFQENKILFYYTGWNLTKNVPFNNSIGIAEWNINKKVFERYGDGPVMTRTLHEPYSCASPFVMYDDGIYKMWYASMDKWDAAGSEVKHYYNIKYAESVDGVQWKRDVCVVIDYEKDDEYAFGRPFVIKEYETYKMWYAFRGESYRIGYAESSDGKVWKRMDSEAGIDVSFEGWDSEMIEYPAIFDLNDNRYMLYNGNGYGKTGIGLAVLK